MNKNFRLAIMLIFSLGLFMPKLCAQEELPFKDEEATISMDLRDANLKDVLKVFSMQSGLNFIAEGSLQDKKVTLYLDKVPIRDALEKVFQANNLAFDLDKTANIVLVKDLGKPMVETITKVFYLKYATVSSSALEAEKKTASITSVLPDSGIAGVIRKLLSSDGTLVEDSRTNSLVITDTPARMERITQTIAALDVPAPQVMLEVEILDVNKSITENIGFQYSKSPFTATLQGAYAPIGFPFQNWSHMFNNPIPGTPNTPATMTGSTLGTVGVNAASAYTVTMDYLMSQTDTKILARPKLLTLNNQTAEIQITSNEAIGVLSAISASSGGNVTSATADRSPAGVSLRVTPQINMETGEVTMFILPDVSSNGDKITLQSGGENYDFINPAKSATKSIVRIKDGDTVVIGGLIHKEKSQTISKLPFLGDIPVVGALFRHKGIPATKDRELLIFITPHIIKDKSTELAQTKKLMLPEREQGTLTGVVRQSVINSYLNTFERKAR